MKKFWVNLAAILICILILAFFVALGLGLRWLIIRFDLWTIRGGLK